MRILVRGDRVIEEEKGSHLYSQVSFLQKLHPKKKNFGICLWYMWRVKLCLVFIEEVQLMPIGLLVPKS